MCCEARSRAAAVRYASVRPGVPENSRGPRTGGRAATDGRDGSGYADRPPGLCPACPATAAGPAPPGVTTRQVSGSMALRTGGPPRHRWRGTADPGISKPGCYTGGSRRLPGGAPELARRPQAKTRRADPVDLVTQGSRPRCALMRVERTPD